MARTKIRVLTSESILRGCGMAATAGDGAFCDVTPFDLFGFSCPRNNQGVSGGTAADGADGEGAYPLCSQDPPTLARSICIRQNVNIVGLGIARAKRDLFLSSFQDIPDDPSH